MRKLIAGAAAGSALLLMAPAAIADEQIQATFQNRYANPQVTIDQGERLTFRNNDVSRHDVVSDKTGEDRKPIFSTPLIGQNEEAFVEGSQYLTTGSYSFFCSVHSNMKGTITVTAAGTPVPRPGGGGATGGGTADTAKPKVSASLRTTSARSAARGFVVRVKANEKTTYRVTVKRGSRTLATKVFKNVAAGTRNVTVKPSSTVRKGKVTVTVSAKDAAGNRTKVTRSYTLK